MKNISFFIAGLLLIIGCMTSYSNNNSDNLMQAQTSVSGEVPIKILSSPELNGLTANWIREYIKLNPTLVINSGRLNDYHQKVVGSLSFVTDEFQEAVKNESLWKMIIGHDAVVPFINHNNPMFEEINRQGLTPLDFVQLLTDPQNQNWESMISGGQNIPVHIYVLDNDFVKKKISMFTGIAAERVIYKEVSTSTELITALRKDIYGIGFSKLTDIRDNISNDFIENIKPLPIDRNQNGRIDYFENIYADMDAFIRGVWIGKYPAGLCGNIYALAPSKPADKNELTFLTWIIGDGQQFLKSNGYSEIAGIQKQSDIQALAPQAVFSDADAGSSYLRFLIPALFALVVTGLIILTFVIIRKEKTGALRGEITLAHSLNENSILAPGGLFFDKTHTWVFMEKNGMVRIGIDDFLQHITGKITRVKLKFAGDMVRKGEKLLTIIHEGKQLSIYAPVSGTIIEHNLKLMTDSAIINSFPYSDGWVYMIKPKNWLREIQFLVMSEKYREWLSDEFIRLKDFFASLIKSNSFAYSHVVLQDGGEITDNVLSDLGPEVWEDFQAYFLDKSK